MVCLQKELEALLTDYERYCHSLILGERKEIFRNLWVILGVRINSQRCKQNLCYLLCTNLGKNFLNAGDKH